MRTRFRTGSRLEKGSRERHAGDGLGGDEHVGADRSEDITIAETSDTSPAERRSSRPALTPGMRLGRYVLLEEVGTGGMGVVMAAFDHELGRRVALKLLRPHMSHSGETRMKREAQSLAQLQHPSVVTVYEVGKLDGQLFIAMEYIEGKTFDAWAAGHRSQWRTIVEVAVTAGRGLAAAHAAGLVHRDIKPSNILVGRDGRVCVADFGIAVAATRGSDSRASGRHAVLNKSPNPEETVELAGSMAVASSSIRVDGLHYTEAGVVVGTPAYMAPEQHRGRVVDARSDQFAFCVTLYRVLYDDMPFGGDDLEALRASVDAGVVKPPPPGSTVPPSVRRVLLRGLEVEPQRRWPTMTALLDALERTLGRRRRWVVSLGAVGAVGLVATAVTVMATDAAVSSEVACPTADERLAGVWDDERQTGMREAFLATELPYALDSWERTRERLDRHAEAWSTRYQALCTAMSDEAAGAAIDLEMGCLGRRREELSALVDLMLEGDAAVVAKATEAAADLETVESCRTLGQEAAAMAEPTPEQREAVEEIRLTLARAEAAFKTGTFELGIDHAQLARAQAQAVGYVPAEVEALYRLGTLQGVTSQLAEAEKSLSDAALRAVEVRHDRVAARAAAMLAFVVGYQQGRAEDGMVWIRHATAALDRLGPDRALEAELRITRAAILTAQGRYEEALPEFRIALQQRREEFGDVHPKVASSYNNLGSALVDIGRYDEALEALEQAKAIWEKTYGPSHPVVATAINGLGVVLERSGRWPEALVQLEAALALREATFGPEHVNVAITLDNLGSVLTRLGRYDEARDASQRALELRGKHLGLRHPHYASSLVNLGLVAEKQGRLDEALEHHRRAQEIWEEALGPDHPYIAFPLTSMGRAEHGRGNDTQARALLERALKLRAASGSPYELAETEFALAQVCWSTEPLEARGSAERAVAHLRDEAHAGADLRRTIEAWLRAHPIP